VGAERQTNANADAQFNAAKNVFQTIIRVLCLGVLCTVHQKHKTLNTKTETLNDLGGVTKK
jgi:hypothetical protein